MTFVLGGLAALFLALSPVAATAQDGPFFELIDPPVLDDPKNWGGTWTVDNGQVGLDLYNDGKYVTSHGWSLPASFDATGFDLMLYVNGGVICGPISMGTSVSSDDFTFADDIRSTDANTISEGTFPDCPQAIASNNATIHVVPNAGTYGIGDKLELYVGAAYGPGVRYTYTVTRAGTSDGTGAVTTLGDDDDDMPDQDDEGALQAVIDCPDSIVINELPGLQCALEISGYERNTSAPVVVTSPTEVDGYGNTESGIQLSVLTGSADPSNWDDSYHWPFSPFACEEGSPGVGANCYDNFAVPGDVVIPIVVSQEGVGSVTVGWSVKIIGGKIKGKKGRGVGIVLDGAETFIFRNRAVDGLVTASASIAALTSSGTNNLDARWYVLTLDDGTNKICNVANPLWCLHTEYGVLEFGEVGNDWLSARWSLEGPDGTGFRIRNIWRSDQYITLDGAGNLVIQGIDPNSMAQVWSSVE